MDVRKYNYSEVLPGCSKTFFVLRPTVVGRVGVVYFGTLGFLLRTGPVFAEIMKLVHNTT